MLVVRLRKGELILYIHTSRDHKVDYMIQAADIARPYLAQGWHMIYAKEE